MLLIGLLRQSSVPVQLKLRKLGHDGMHGRENECVFINYE